MTEEQNLLFVASNEQSESEEEENISFEEEATRVGSAIEEREEVMSEGKKNHFHFAI